MTASMRGFETYPGLPQWDHELYQADEAELLYAAGEITARQYLHRTRRVFLRELDTAILDSIRQTLTVERAVEAGLLRKEP